MLKTRQCLLGIRTFLGVTSRIWGFIMYILRKHLRTVRTRTHADPVASLPALLMVRQRRDGPGSPGPAHLGRLSLIPCSVFVCL